MYTDMPTKSHIDNIGEMLRSLPSNTDGYDAAISELNQWRESHGPAMDYYFDLCNEITNHLKNDRTVAQRLKRLPTILDKIQRYPDMQLSRMQDIAGVRVIVKDVATVRSIQEKLTAQNLKSYKDYIAKPKPTGYRSCHLVFKRDGLLVEVQLRTRLQHLWATSVETMDMYLGTSMKTSIASDTYWQQFFALVASAFAYFEDQHILPQYQDLSISNICKLLQDLIKEYDLFDQIQTCAFTRTTVDQAKKTPGAYYATMSLNLPGRVALVQCFKESEYGAAVKDYETLERNFPENNNVLVAVDNIKKLQAAYPNYFMNLREFVDKIKLMLAIYNKNK